MNVTEEKLNKLKEIIPPDKEESVNFDHTENVFIEGENLEADTLVDKEKK